MKRQISYVAVFGHPVPVTLHNLAYVPDGTPGMAVGIDLDIPESLCVEFIQPGFAGLQLWAVGFDNVEEGADAR